MTLLFLLAKQIAELQQAEAQARLDGAKRLVQALGDLRAGEAAIVGLTRVEIAERLNEPLGTVKTRLRLGLLKLRDLLRQEEE